MMLWFILRVLNTLGSFSANLLEGDNFCDFLFEFLLTKHFLKWVYYKSKEFASIGSKFFPFRAVKYVFDHVWTWF